jgi:hypothetical protein
MNKKINLWVQKWSDGQPPQFFLKFFYKKIKIKKLRAILEVLDTIGQIGKI